MIRGSFSLRTIFILVAIAAFFSSVLLSFINGSAWGKGVWSAVSLLMFTIFLGVVVTWIVTGMGKIIVRRQDQKDQPRQVI
ncbi:MAG: hypothetical protein KF851_17295 [Pirellulaceae bacterium]|jgi:hypothetical protein|nr:hypothetical protein [Pirellulaceae bacterium]